MNSKTLIIYKYQILYEILSEIKEYLNFDILDINQKNFETLELDKFDDYLILSSKDLPEFKNCIVLEDLPIKIYRLIQTININFLTCSITDKFLFTLLTTSLIFFLKSSSFTIDSKF